MQALYGPYNGQRRFIVESLNWAKSLTCSFNWFEIKCNWIKVRSLKELYFCFFLNIHVKNWLKKTFRYSLKTRSSSLLSLYLVPTYFLVDSSYFFAHFAIKQRVYEYVYVPTIKTHQTLTSRARFKFNATHFEIYGPKVYRWKPWNPLKSNYISRPKKNSRANQLIKYVKYVLTINPLLLVTLAYNFRRIFKIKMLDNYSS